VKLLVCNGLLLAFACSAASLEWKDLGNGRLQLLDQGKPAFVYNYGPQLADGAPADRKRASYIYPIHTPAGVSVTDDFPKDHYHHRGVFWAWPVVETGGKKYDLWMMKGGIEDRFERWISRKASPREAVLEMETGWYADGAKILKETVRIVAKPAAGKSRELDITLTLEPFTGPVTLKAHRKRERVTEDSAFDSRHANRRRSPPIPAPSPKTRISSTTPGRNSPEPTPAASALRCASTRILQILAAIRNGASAITGSPGHRIPARTAPPSRRESPSSCITKSR
jgi:hypothetical protein